MLKQPIQCSNTKWCKMPNAQTRQTEEVHNTQSTNVKTNAKQLCLTKKQMPNAEQQHTTFAYRLVWYNQKAKLEMQYMWIDQTTPRSHILQLQWAYWVSSTRRIDTKTVHTWGFWYYPANTHRSGDTAWKQRQAWQAWTLLTKPLSRRGWVLKFRREIEMEESPTNWFNLPRRQTSFFFISFCGSSISSNFV